MGYRDKYCNQIKFEQEHSGNTCWQYDYMYQFLFGNDKDMQKVCFKCIYYKENQKGKGK